MPSSYPNIGVAPTGRPRVVVRWELVMIVVGLVLLIVGFVLKIAILWSLGIIVLLVGVVLLILGSIGREVGGRRHYW